MNKLLLAAVPATLAIAACSSPNVQEVHSSEPMVFVQSARAPGYISSCLQSRIDGLRMSTGTGSTELTVGHGADNYAWLITLIPSGNGSVVKVQKSPGDDGSVPEPEMRFDIARCTT
ncbi:hypothetical protein FAZ69_03640 [Trinickia terrae]|uniref:Sugar ABC transporter ATPase n=1 Tax=Trinickia terrae TaxID=2571161 RepID=A0A4U1ID40_9BURK|nr:hypothetical protein [Trinickia terrae]TKC91554.1 hypothetical protein FAZ69_03640 [Trinickia terrae]